MTPDLDVAGIGNAIVDVLSQSTDAFLADNQLDKGAMMLVDEERAHALYEKMSGRVEQSGGSAGNTMAGIASLGGRGAYVGKVKNDTLGESFARDMRASGIRFDTPPATDGAATARCLIFVTPDAQRTMNTFLGACVGLTPDDIDERVITASKVTYLEGYLYDPPQAKEAFIKAAKLAHNAGRKVSLTLSDSFCVDRHREAFQELVAHHVDVLFANEAEITSLYQSDSFEAAARHVRGKCEIAALTRSEKGSIILSGEDTFEVAAAPVTQVVDTTGAGDLYAAGFLYGLTQGKDLAVCGRIGALAAGEVISHFGARPEHKLSELVASQL